MMSVSLEEIFILGPPSILTPSACIFKCSFVSNDEIRELKESESLSEEISVLAFKPIPLLSALILISSVSDFRLTATDNRLYHKFKINRKIILVQFVETAGNQWVCLHLKRIQWQVIYF